jgi:methyl-accepting chemotaxis protein
VTEAIGLTASNAKVVDHAVSEVAGYASDGGKIMDATVVAMDKIKTSSSEIAKIIEVIDGIAFQTNLLALNAGVEAARAGEAGKGFAVVASEVRALAHRTTTSAKDIKDLVTHSSVDVQEGAKLVADMQSALAQIIERLGETAGKAEEIASHSEHLSVSVESLNSQLRQIDFNTQQNAAMVEESNAAARSLSEQASGMARIVGKFQFERRDKLRVAGEDETGHLRREAPTGATTRAA